MNQGALQPRSTTGHASHG